MFPEVLSEASKKSPSPVPVAVFTKGDKYNNCKFVTFDQPIFCTAATANLGGGGGGSGGNGGSNGGNGGKGVVILSMPTASYSSTTTGSPTVTTSGSNTILQFNV